MADVTLGLTLVDGSVLSAPGFFNLQNYQNQDGKGTLDLIPRDSDTGWAVFAGTGQSSGTIRSVSINGTTYGVTADCDVTFVPTKYKVEELVDGSGYAMKKMTIQAKKITGVIIQTSVQAIAQLAALQDAG